MEYIQDLLRKYGPSLKIKQLSLNFDDAVYRNDGIIGHNDLLFVFLEFFDVPGGCLVGTTGFFCVRDKEGNRDFWLVGEPVLDQQQLFVQGCLHSIV